VSSTWPSGTGSSGIRRGEIDLSTPQGAAHGAHQGSVARHEAEQIRGGSGSKVAELAEPAPSNGGPRPFGYHRVSPVRASAAGSSGTNWIRSRRHRRRVRPPRAGRKSLGRSSGVRACRVKTSTGREWSQQGPAAHAPRRRIAGLREHQRQSSQGPMADDHQRGGPPAAGAMLDSTQRPPGSRCACTT